MRKTACLLFFLAIVACTTNKSTEVLVLPTIHGAHEVNQNYTYEDLMQIIRSYDPDAIGVEIRPVDMKMNSDSLDVFYPLEMIKVRDSFPGKVTGIDFYSQDTENEPVSRQLFADSTSEMGRIKKLQAAMSRDSTYLSRFEKTGLPGIYEEQKRIALNYTAEEFLQGEYDSITAQQYILEDNLNKATDYEAYSRFNNNRDLQITLNALKLIKNNRGKKILILVGANHRNRLVDSLENRKMDGIKLIRDLRFMQE